MIMWGMDYAQQHIRNRRAPQIRNNVRAWMRSVNWGCLLLVIYMSVIIVGAALMIVRMWE